MRDLLGYWLSLGPDNQAFVVGFAIGFVKGLRHRG